VTAMTTGQPCLRRLLLERQAKRESGWLSIILGQGQDDRSLATRSLFDPPDPMGFLAIDEIASRREIFSTLLRRKSPNLMAPELGADPGFDRLLRDEKWTGDPLSLTGRDRLRARLG
jgi:hypothetical protein